MSSQKEKTYPIHEVFYTFQGEGLNLGRAAYFIRMFGCPVHCPWCDSAGTWHKDWIPDHVDRLTPWQLASKAAESGTSLVVVTGGEPGVQDLKPLAQQLHQVGLVMAVETSGAFPITNSVDFLTVSPKWNAMPLAENLQKANEIKIIVDEVEAVAKWWDVIGAEVSRHTAVWLHPEWSKHRDPAILDAITRQVNANPALFRAGWQLHKLYAADTLDPNTQPLVPLGGNPELGY